MPGIPFLFFLLFFIAGIHEAVGTPSQNRFAQRQSFLSSHYSFALPCGLTHILLGFGGFLLRDCHDAKYFLLAYIDKQTF